jgi:hypothetical protein
VRDHGDIRARSREIASTKLLFMNAVASHRVQATGARAKPAAKTLIADFFKFDEYLALNTD